MEEYREEQRRTLKSRKHHRPSKQKKVPAVLAVLAAAVLLCMGIFLWGRHGPLTLFDPNAVDTPQKPLSEGDILRELQEAADESAFRFKISSEVTVVQGGTAGTGEDPIPSSGSEAEASYSGSHQSADWNIINSIENSCNMEVTITGEDGTVLFESRTLHPGEQELSGSLQTELAPGTYSAEAQARAIDPDTGEVVGNVTAEITLHVQDGN